MNAPIIIQMQIYRVLDMKSNGGQDVYLIQWLGEHRQAAQWLAKADIKRHFPQQLHHLNTFDFTLAQKCSEVRSALSNQPNRPGRRSKPKEGQEINEGLPEGKATSSMQLVQKMRKKGSMTLRHGSDQILSKAKTMLSKEKSTLSIPSSQFKISIFTDSKKQNHWTYQNQVEQIVAKKKGSKYQIVWNDGKKGELSEQVLMERQCTKLCQFWEGQLGLISSKKQKV